MEFVIGGLAATSAGLFTNPLEVIKHHMELNQKSQYASNAKYKNFLQAGFKVAKSDGLKSLQKGLTPALGAHLVSYGMKLGTYQFGYNRGFTTNTNGEVVVPKSILTSSVGGLLGQYLSSPFYLIKTQHEIDAGNSNEKKSDSYLNTIRKIYREYGLRGFFRGATASLPRAFIGTSQLTSFAVAKESLEKYESFQSNPLLTTILAGTVAGVVLSSAMTPFDMVLTKMYKQAISPKKKEKTYEGFLDCMQKTYKANGLRPFYRGMGPIYLKLGPHTVLCLVFWEEFKGMYDKHGKSPEAFYENKFGFFKNSNSNIDNEELSVEYTGYQDQNDFCWN